MPLMATPYFFSHSLVNSGRPPTTAPLDIHTSGARALQPRKRAFSARKSPQSSGMMGMSVHLTGGSETISICARYSAIA
jgi:hypothetical protein